MVVLGATINENGFKFAIKLRRILGPKRRRNYSFVRS